MKIVSTFVLSPCPFTLSLLPHHPKSQSLAELLGEGVQREMRVNEQNQL